jgi:hypothetical protein
MTTIYLSSTYEDLTDYRIAVFEALRKAGYEVLAMEDYVATDRRPVEKCLADVAGADIYVGLFAFRYGYVPPPEHGNPDSLSITEIEFRHAEKLGKPCLTFAVSEDAPWPPKFIDGLKGERINSLREYLLTEKTASFFSSPHQLASLVQAAVTKVAYPLAADNVLRLLPCRLRGVNQPVNRTRNRFSRPRPTLLACIWTHMGRSTPRCSTPAGS